MLASPNDNSAMPKHLLRRDLLHLIGVAAAGGLAAGCRADAPALPASPPPPSPAPSPIATTTARPAPSSTPSPIPSPAISPIATPAPGPTPIAQPSARTPRAFASYAEQMRQLAVASGDQSYGAIVVKDNMVVGLGPSRVIVGNDPTAHAEIEAIRDACRRLGTRDLNGCLLYSTSRPCPMCSAAAYWAHITRMFYGPDALDAGPLSL